MTTEQLRALKPSTAFFVGIDSDGCIFDSMAIKHRECFCPAFIDHFELQPIAAIAREAWEFVNLNSRSRGLNRFISVVNTLALLRKHPRVREMGFVPMPVPGLEAWLQGETRLGNPALESAVSILGDPDLKRALAWSRDVNAAVKRIIRGVPPFASARDSLAYLAGRADVVVVSQTPADTVAAEWNEHGIACYIRGIAGQEAGTKAESIRFATEGRYLPGKMLMIGDSFGDLESARESGALFYPIIPGREELSWARFRDDAGPRFLSGSYAGTYAASLTADFEAALPELAPWESTPSARQAREIAN